MLLGIDIDVDNVAVILAKPDGSTELALRSALPREGGASATWLAAMHTARDTLQRSVTTAAQVQVTVVAFNGSVDQQGVVRKTARAAGWENFDLVRGVQEHLGVGCAMAAGRVMCEAQAEWHLGALRPEAGRKAENWIYIHLGRTIEGAAGVRGTPLEGATGVALDVGSICIERNGVLCSNGRHGCLDGYCGVESFLSRAAGYGLTLKTVAEVWEAAGSNFAARSLCDDYIQRLAQGLGTVLVLLNPDTLVLGGSLIVAPGEDLVRPWQTALREFCQPSHLEPLRIESSRLGHDAAVMGAVSMAWAALQSSSQT